MSSKTPPGVCGALAALVAGLLAAAVLCIIPGTVVWICYALRNNPEGQLWAEVTAGLLGGLVFLPLWGYLYYRARTALAANGTWLLLRAWAIAIPVIFGALFPLASGI